MSVNKSFYSTINDLMKKATGGTSINVTDYSSFIESGRIFIAGGNEEYLNNFVKELCNKIKISIDTARSYAGAYKSCIRGNADPNSVIELVTHYFYETREAAFVDLVDGKTVDQYEIAKPKQDVVYFTNDNAYSIPLTIQLTQLKGAFKTPEAMDRFVSSSILYLMNSNELARENARIGMAASFIIDINEAGGAATTIHSASKLYNLVTLYKNATGDSTVTSANCLTNKEFVRFAVMVIKMVMKKMSRVSRNYSLNEAKTFTPESAANIYLHSALSSAIAAYINTSEYNPQYSLIEKYEDVPFWQSEATPMKVEGKTEMTEGTSVTVDNVIALIVDEFAMMEFVCHEQMHTSPFNARGEYYDNWLNVQTKLIRNYDANSVLFTLN